MKISKEKFLLVAIRFLKDELECRFNDLQHVCSDHRMAGGSSYSQISGVFDTQASLGNEATTNEKNPAKTIVVSIGSRKEKFKVEEIYNLIKNPCTASKQSTNSNARTVEKKKPQQKKRGQK